MSETSRIRTVDHTDHMKVLYVDDEPNILRAFARTVQRSGFDVHCMSDPDEAMKRLRDEHFDIVAVDYKMPGITGVQFLERIRSYTPHAYKIMITGMCDFEVLQAAINRAGVHQYLTKPWRVDTLKYTMNSAASHARLIRQNRALQQQLEQQNKELATMNAALDRLVRTRTLNVLNALVAALDYRDTETHWHSRRVALFARMIGTKLGLSDEALYDVELGALLHDVGKIGISDSILLKPGKLTEDEWREMRRHPQIGYELLKGIDFLEGARPIVLHHHERWDGNGYPSQLRAEEICIGARIFAVCDTLDAMTSDRPYRKALSFDIAKEEIMRNSGSQFDAEVVAAFLKVTDAQWRAAIVAGHAYENQPADQGLGDVLAKASVLLPEFDQTVAWQAAAAFVLAS
jgi:response regulator RpfG family c-di-GMP phosphodiesterase